MAINEHARALLGPTHLVAVDCGAARGLLPHWRNLANVAQLYLVEPDPEARPGIELALRRDGVTSKVEIIQEALSGTGGPRTLYVPPARSSASLLETRMEVALEYGDRANLVPMREVTIETRTLGAVLDERSVAAVDMIKLDVQGVELEVLKSMGAQRSSKLFSVELEVGMHDAVVGQPPLAAVQSFMDDNGLELFDLVPKHTHLNRDGASNYYHREVFGTYPNAPTIAGRLWEVDATYFRRSDLAIQGGADDVRKLCFAYCVYGFFAHAHRLAERARAASVIDRGEESRIQREVVAWHRRLHLRAAPANVLGRVVRKLSEKTTVDANAPPSATRMDY